MLFAARFHPALRTGQLDLTFRRWRAPRVRVGAVYRVVGDIALRVKSVTEVSRITTAEARRAGFDSVAALEGYLTKSQRGSGRSLYRIEFERTAVPRDARTALAKQHDDRASRAALERRLAAMDRRSVSGAWTSRVLQLIDVDAGRRAADLAARMGWDTPTFKARVRRLKALGLTESLAVGYRLTPRGRRLRDALTR
jgi:hypothetical protein